MNVRHRWLLTLFLLTVYSCRTFCQHPYELKVTSENDNYCLQYHDGYYTNGLFVNFTYVPDRLNQRIDETRKLTKITSSYQLGQMIFTPENIKTDALDQFDRPYAGYLYAQKGMTFFYKRGHVLNANLSVGTVGKASLAQQTQSFIHTAFDLTPPKGWRYQVRDALGVNAQVQYWHAFIPVSWRRRWFDVHGTSQATFGTTFVNASAGLLFQLGLFQKADQSSLYDARIDRKSSPGSNSAEFYVFYHPRYQYQVHNATVAGSLFESHEGAILASINPWLYRHDIGLVFAKPRWTFQVVYSFKQREAASMKHNEQYAGLSVAYRFGR